MPYFELKKAEGKRPSPSALPYRESKGKETTRSFLGKLLAPPARVRTRKGPSKSERYRLAGATAREIIETCFGTSDDHAIWAKVVYDYPESADDILEKARVLASEWRQGERRFPARSFQKWLGEKFPKRTFSKMGS